MEHIEQTLRELEADLEGSEYQKSGVIYLAAFHLGPDEQKISDFTKIPIDEVNKRGQLLRENGLWKDGKVLLEDAGLDDPDTVCIGLLLGIMCADGLVRRVTQDDAPKDLLTEKGELELGATDPVPQVKLRVESPVDAAPEARETEDMPAEGQEEPSEIEVAPWQALGKATKS